MPLSDEQKAAIQTLKGIATDDVQEFATELKGANQAAYQGVFRAGFKEAETRWKPRAEQAETKLTEAESAKAEAERQLQEAQSKQPDVAKLNEQWQAKLDKQKADLEAAVTAEKTRAAGEREARKVADLKASLNGLDPVYVGAVVATEAARIRFKEDGTPELYEAGSDIPTQLPAGKTPYAVLAEEIRSKADPRWVLAGGDSGSGTESGTRGGGGYDPVAAGKKMAEEAKQGAGQDSLAFR